MHYNDNILASSASQCAGSKRKRSGQDPSLQEEIAWTAARCNRLLRTINSRIVALRRLVRSDNAPEDARKVESKGTASRVAPTRKCEHWSVKDPVWVPGGGAKAPGRTYAAKACPAKTVKHTSKNVGKKGSVAFPSPFIKQRAKSSDLAHTQSQEPTARKRRSRQLPLKSTTEIQDAEKGLKTALSHLLCTTQAPEAISTNGARSLVGTCLRRVPDYIQLDSAVTEDGQASDNTSSEIYAYLEEFGSRPGSGWEGLREVVRSHAVHLICEAIEDSIIGDEVVQELVDICNLRNTVSAGQKMLEAWMSTTTSLQSTHLETWKNFSRYHGCYAAMYRVLRRCGEQDVGCFSRFAESPFLWNGLLRCLTSARTSEGVDYLVSAIDAICVLEEEGGLKARTGAIARDFVMKLAAMAVSSVLSFDHAAKGAMLVEAIHSCAVRVALSSVKPRAIDDSGSGASSSFVRLFLLLSAFVLDLSGCPRGVLTSAFMLDVYRSRNETTDRHARRVLRDETADTASDLAEAICDLEKCFGSLITIDVLVQRIVERAEAATAFSRQVAMAVLATLKQNENIDDSCIAAYLTQLAAHGKIELDPRTPFQKAKPRHIRWEDGLCEWVSATPFSATDGHAPEQLNGVGEDQEDQQEVPAPGHVLSPDVLAPTPTIKRAKVDAEPGRPIVLIRRQEVKSQSARLSARVTKRCTSSRPSAKEDPNGSGDELGL